VSVVLIKRILMFRGRDKGSSVAYDYDNKTMTLRTTAIFTQYTVCKIVNERQLTFDAMF
jgi:hypothetical protein